MTGPAVKTETQPTQHSSSWFASFSHIGRALRHRNFRLFYFGQSISVIGTWMTRIATIWLVYRLTHSALLLGVVSFSGQIAAFVLGPFAGVWVERMNRRKLLVWTQAAGAVQSLALAALTLTLTTWRLVAGARAFNVSRARARISRRRPLRDRPRLRAFRAALPRATQRSSPSGFRSTTPSSAVCRPIWESF